MDKEKSLEIRSIIRKNRSLMYGIRFIKSLGLKKDELLELATNLKYNVPYDKKRTKDRIIEYIVRRSLAVGNNIYARLCLEEHICAKCQQQINIGSNYIYMGNNKDEYCEKCAVELGLIAGKYRGEPWGEIQ